MKEKDWQDSELQRELEEQLQDFLPREDIRRSETQTPREDARTSRQEMKERRQEEKERRQDEKLQRKEEKFLRKEDKLLRKEEKRDKKEQRRRNREMHVIMYIFVGLFVLLAGYFSYFEAVLRENTINNPYNSRSEMLSEKIVRGSILANDGTVLAETRTVAGDKEIRYYPYGSMYAHAIGYSTHGMSGLEAQANYMLLTSNANIVERVGNDIQEEKNTGDSLVTTLDPILQAAAFNALGDQRGAVAAVDPKTGKILCMVSKPDFDPNQIDDQWDTWNSYSAADSVFVNRAAQGSYAPGSTFKIVTLLEYMRENPEFGSFTFTCKGSVTEGDYTINCYHKTSHGNETLKEAFADSCNSAFAEIGLGLDENTFSETCTSLMFNSELPLEMNYTKSSFDLLSDSADEYKMMTAIGQGKTTISPMHLLMLTSAIANDGVLMQPYMTDHIVSATGGTIRRWRPKSLGSLITSEEAAALSEYMHYTVEDGTGRKLKDLGLDAAGKTGSAEFSSDKNLTHAWFTGFASDGTKDLAVVVIVEGGGSGSETAVPIAKRLFEAYFQ